MVRLAEQLGLPLAQIFSTPTSIMAAFGSLGSQRSHLLRVEPGSVNLTQVSQLDRLAVAVLQGELAPIDGIARLREIEEQPSGYGRIATVGAFVAASGAVVACSWAAAGRNWSWPRSIGLATGLLALYAGPRPRVQRVFEPLVALMASVVAGVAGAAVAAALRLRRDARRAHRADPRASRSRWRCASSPPSTSPRAPRASPAPPRPSSASASAWRSATGSWRSCWASAPISPRSHSRSGRCRSRSPWRASRSPSSSRPSGATRSASCVIGLVAVAAGRRGRALPRPRARRLHGGARGGRHRQPLLAGSAIARRSSSSCRASSCWCRAPSASAASRRCSRPRWRPACNTLFRMLLTAVRDRLGPPHRRPRLAHATARLSG